MAKTVKKKVSKTAPKPAVATAAKKTVAKKVTKKKVSKKATAKKTVAKKTVAKKKGAAPASAAPARSVTAAERYRMIQEGAYLRAEARGFSGGDPNEDWLAAEAEVDARLKKSGVTVTK